MSHKKMSERGLAVPTVDLLPESEETSWVEEVSFQFSHHLDSKPLGGDSPSPSRVLPTHRKASLLSCVPSFYGETLCKGRCLHWK